MSRLWKFVNNSWSHGSFHHKLTTLLFANAWKKFTNPTFVNWTLKTLSYACKVQLMYPINSPISKSHYPCNYMRVASICVCQIINYFWSFHFKKNLECFKRFFTFLPKNKTNFWELIFLGKIQHFLKKYNFCQTHQGTMVLLESEFKYHYSTLAALT